MKSDFCWTYIYIYDISQPICWQGESSRNNGIVTDWNLEWPDFFYIFFYPEDRTWPISGGFGSNLESSVMIFLYFGERGSKFQSVNTKTSQFSKFFDLHEFEKNMSTPKVWEKTHVNTKTSQFSPFFDLHEFEKNMSTPKLVNFPNLFGFQEFEKKHVNTKASQFSPFFGFQEFEKNMSTPKLVNFHHFWIPGVWEKHVNTKTS